MGVLEPSSVEVNQDSILRVVGCTRAVVEQQAGNMLPLAEIVTPSD